MRPEDRPRRAAAVVGAGCLASTTVAAALAVVVSIVDGRLSTTVAAIPPVVIVALGWLIVARSANRIGWVFCAYGLFAALQNAGLAWARWALADPLAPRAAWRIAAGVAVSLPLVVNGLAVGVVPQLFPAGRPISPRWRPGLVAAAGFIVAGAVGNGFADQEIEGLDHVSNPWAVPAARALWTALQAVAGLCLFVMVGFGVASVVVRWRRGAGDERQQLKWLLVGVVPYLLVVVVHDAVSQETADLLAPIAFSALPVAIAIAVLRYRLYDLDLLLNRTLVYGAVTVVVAAVYLAAVGVAQVVVVSGESLGVQVAAAVLAALSLQPARTRVQRAVDHAFYGDRARPYEVLARFGVGLESAADPEQVLERVVRTIVDHLRVPAAAVDLGDEVRWTRAVEHGVVDAASAVLFPMAYQGHAIGRLVVARRGRDEPFSVADARLLTELARQASLAAHAARVTIDLRRSRTDLVAAREEERRRLRRDLHDGLGPALAGINLRLHAARRALRRDPDRADSLLGDATTHVADAVVDIRRLVYGLRPPALDEVGLVEAIRRHVATFDADFGCTITVDGPPLAAGSLPAAAEVAAYRIVNEAVTNALRHASASTCAVRIVVDDELVVSVEDDGTGTPDGAKAGVGVAAMRERAQELGGSLAIASCSSGTTVRARIPLGLT